MTGSILLVDDDEQFRSMLNEALTDDGYEVVAASNGQQALRLYAAQPTDLVITDLVMPEKEGLEMITEIKRLYPEVKIIAISGGGRSGAKHNYLQLAKAFGAQRTLAKPFLHHEMLEAITHVLEG
jgi:CheY-like chemotaxis protein